MNAICCHDISIHHDVSVGSSVLLNLLLKNVGLTLVPYDLMFIERSNRVSLEVLSVIKKLPRLKQRH